jgi:hypothetical protein
MIDLYTLDHTLHCLRSAGLRLTAMADEAMARNESFGLQDIVLSDDIEGLGIARDTLVALAKERDAALAEIEALRVERDAVEAIDTWRTRSAKAETERDAALAKLAEVERERDSEVEALRKQLATRTEALQTANGTSEYWRAEAEAAWVERDRRPAITPEDAKAWLSGNDDDSDVADALRDHGKGAK